MTEVDDLSVLDHGRGEGADGISGHEGGDPSVRIPGIPDVSAQRPPFLPEGAGSAGQDSGERSA
jgi:hypothetical protein